MNYKFMINPKFKFFLILFFKGRACVYVCVNEKPKNGHMGKKNVSGDFLSISVVEWGFLGQVIILRLGGPTFMVS